jgi:hypothetical protein
MRHPSWWKAFLVWAACCSLIPLFLWWGSCSRHRRQDTSPATPEQAFVIGGQVILVDGYDPENEDDEDAWRRVTSVDATTGAITARRVEDLDQLECWARADGSLACSFDTTHVLDARTLATVAGDGGAEPNLPSEECAIASSVPGWELVGSEQQRVVRRVHDDVRPTARHWFYPGFLADASGAPVLADGDPVITAGTHVARIGAKEDAVWDDDLGGGCRASTVVDGALVIASDRPHDRVVSIDLATGAIRWTAGY